MQRAAPPPPVVLFLLRPATTAAGWWCPPHTDRRHHPPCCFHTKSFHVMLLLHHLCLLPLPTTLKSITSIFFDKKGIALVSFIRNCMTKYQYKNAEPASAEPPLKSIMLTSLLSATSNPHLTTPNLMLITTSYLHILVVGQASCETLKVA
jgi:hypothetical protein